MSEHNLAGERAKGAYVFHLYLAGDAPNDD